MCADSEENTGHSCSLKVSAISLISSFSKVVMKASFTFLGETDFFIILCNNFGVYGNKKKRKKWKISVTKKETSLLNIY